MISEEKMIHVLHLMMDGLKKNAFITYNGEEEAIREARKVCLKYITQMNGVVELAKNRILSLKKPPMEQTPEWENLYQKYLEEELNKVGG